MVISTSSLPKGRSLLLYSEAVLVFLSGKSPLDRDKDLVLDFVEAGRRTKYHTEDIESNSIGHKILTKVTTVPRQSRRISIPYSKKRLE
jgi:hypothetical protein